MYAIFSDLCKKNGVSVYKVSKETGIPLPTFSDWKYGKSKPKAEKLLLVADYFGVPLEIFYR